MTLGLSQKYGLSAKIIFVVLAVTFSLSAFLLVMTNHNLGRIVREKSTQDCRERLKVIHGILTSKNQALQAAGATGPSLEAYQKEVLQELRDLYYSREITAYPFIIDGQGHVVMHPESGQLAAAPEALLVQNLVAGCPQEVVDYHRNGEKKWAVLRAFDPWGWTLGFSTTDEVLLQAFHVCLKHFLFPILMAACLLILFLVLFLRRQIICPLKELGEQFFDIMNPEIVMGEKLRRRRDDIGVLARSFCDVKAQLIDSCVRIKTKNEELIESVRLAEGGLVAKSQFIANISHEIRTPLSAVIGMISLLLDTDLSCDQRRYAEAVRTAGASLLSLINDVLDFSEVKSGVLIMENMDFDLLSLMDELCKTMTLSAQKKGLELLCQAEPAVPACLTGDPGRLRQVLISLAGNAIKFTEVGEVSIQVSLISETSEQAVIRFSVRDTGIGIPSEQQAAIFQQFTQVDGSSTRSRGGVGLGLAISSQLIKNMQGTFGMESTVGVGSEFWFTVCFHKQKHLQLNTSAQGRDLHILVVEDNVTNQEVAQGLLEKMGLSSDVVGSGAEALQALERTPYDIVFMDVQMPEMDGLTAARTIRQLETKSGDPVIIAMTAHAICGDRERCLDAGMDDYLSKPVSFAALSKMIEKWIPAQENEELLSDPAVEGAVQEATGQALPVFDRAGMRQNLMEEEDLIEAIIKSFLLHTPALLQSLNEALETDDQEVSARQAHSIKGASSSVGGLALCAVALQMETHARAGCLAAAKELLPELNTQFTLLVNRLEKE